MAGKTKAERRAENGGDAPPSSGEKSAKRRGKDQGWPWWLWGVSAIAILAVVGQIFGNESSPKRKGKAGKSEAGSTQGYLSLALRLSEMTQIATALKASEQLDGEAAETLNGELNDIEQELESLDDAMARDLRETVKIIRGTMYQQSHNLSDAQVEAMNNSFTYANPRYWDEYYKKTDEAERFDWYTSWDTVIKETSFAPMNTGEQQKAGKLRDILVTYLKQDAKILMLGCGNSDMSEKMYQAGFEQIVNIDISEQLLQNLRQKQEAAMPKMQWLYMSASNMTFDSGSFDITVDKGTLDAMEQNKELVLGSVRESHRILRPGGLFISVTFNAADIRITNQLEKEVSWSSCYTHPFEKEAVTKEGERKFFVHVCVRP